MQTLKRQLAGRTAAAAAIVRFGRGAHMLPSAVIQRQQTSAQGSDPVKLRPWRRLTLAALLLAAATLGGVFFGVAQAQDADGAITGLALSSDSPGELTVSWDMPSPEATDYRVDWAKSSESYQSYKVDEGHVYPDGSLTTVTVTDLEAGAEYKVRMRARYNQGEHADSPWSGPWQVASLTVASEPTPTPTPEPTAEPTPEPTPDPESGAIGSPTATGDNAGRLVIAWQAPQAPHDAPTDYRVSWARSVDDYPSYTEEHGNAHPATTHAYPRRPGPRHRIQNPHPRPLLSQRSVRRSLERAVDGDQSPGGIQPAGHSGKFRRSGRADPYRDGGDLRGTRHAALARP